MATIQFKRGTAERWKEVNPILEAGQPCYITDENRMKIGDGVTPWTELPYIGEASIVSKATHFEFPSVGRENVIYKAESEKTLYQWNTTELKYEVVGSSDGSSGELPSIKVIRGGVAAE